VIKIRLCASRPFSNIVLIPQMERPDQPSVIVRSEATKNQPCLPSKKHSNQIVARP
jgi:hypothetical protein